MQRGEHSVRDGRLICLDLVIANAEDGDADAREQSSASGIDQLLLARVVRVVVDLDGEQAVSVVDVRHHELHGSGNVDPDVQQTARTTSAHDGSNEHCFPSASRSRVSVDVERERPTQAPASSSTSIPLDATLQRAEIEQPSRACSCEHAVELVDRQYVGQVDEGSRDGRDTDAIHDGEIIRMQGARRQEREADDPAPSPAGAHHDLDPSGSALEQSVQVGRRPASQRSYLAIRQNGRRPERLPRRLGSRDQHDTSVPSHEMVAADARFDLTAGDSPLDERRHADRTVMAPRELVDHLVCQTRWRVDDDSCPVHNHAGSLPTFSSRDMRELSRLRNE